MPREAIVTTNPMAFARSPGGRKTETIAMLMAPSIAPPTAWRAQEPTSRRNDGERAQKSDPNENTRNPARNIRRKPIRSESFPEDHQTTGEDEQVHRRDPGDEAC